MSQVGSIFEYCIFMTTRASSFLGVEYLFIYLLSFIHLFIHLLNLLLSISQSLVGEGGIKPGQVANLKLGFSFNHFFFLFQCTCLPHRHIYLVCAVHWDWGGFVDRAAAHEPSLRETERATDATTN